MFFLGNMNFSCFLCGNYRITAPLHGVIPAFGEETMVCIIPVSPHTGALHDPEPVPSRLMTIARKLKFAAFYLYLKLLRARRRGQVLGPREQHWYAQQRAAQGEQADLDAPEARSVRNAFWIRGRFAEGELQLNALVVSRQLKFGNAILQLTNAIQLAQQLGVHKIYHRGFDFLSNRAQVGTITLLKGAPEHENYLASSFFPNALLNNICRSPEPRYQIARQLAPWLTLQHGRTASGDTRRHLYIHLRAGDVFEKSTPHPLYGQPPLSFYTLILRMERWEKVVLVFENRRNPVIDALMAFLISERIPVEIQSRDLDTDAARLLEAENIVIGRGTFVYPMLCISDNVRRVFCFESDGAEEWGLNQSGIQFIRVVDQTGKYRDSVLRRWLNNAEQRALMLNYSEDNLAVRA